MLGERKFSAWEHEGALIVGRWSARGTRLLTGGADGQVILWSRVDQGGTAGRVDRRISYHKEPVMDVTWRSDEKFIASSSQDLSVCIWKVDGPVDDSNKPWKIYKGDPEGKEVGHTVSSTFLFRILKGGGGRRDKEMPCPLIFLSLSHIPRVNLIVSPGIPWESTWPHVVMIAPLGSGTWSRIPPSMCFKLVGTSTLSGGDPRLPLLPTSSLSS